MPDAETQTAGATREDVVRDVRALATDLEDLLDRTRSSLTESLDRHPYLTLGAAAAAGYVLAGGLASRITALAFGFGARFATTTVLSQLAAGAAGGPARRRNETGRNRNGSRASASERIQ